MGTAPVVGELARWWLALVGTAGDSERSVVVVEEFEPPVMARALGIEPVVVVAADPSEVLVVEEDGERRAVALVAHVPGYLPDGHGLGGSAELGAGSPGWPQKSLRMRGSSCNFICILYI